MTLDKGEKEELQERYTILMKCYALAEDRLRDIHLEEWEIGKEMEEMDAEMDYIEEKYLDVQGAFK